MYVNIIACVRVKWGENEYFRIKSGVREACVISSWFFNVYMDAVIIERKLGMGRREVRFLERGREWRFPGLLYSDDLVLCGESEKDLKVMVRCVREEV